ncbi:hypothetical protein [Microtetraspora niveoalba]|uniref:hypothetical protein n=1 Tax=Microtetraspora niveoalba TaxID=46175 RepID=UPI000ABBA4CD|nr:hypothetical protein [Microtetraspora niveoalba]
MTSTASVSGQLGDLPGTVGLTADRIAQESLRNAMRHAPGSDLTAELIRDGDEMQVRMVNSLPTAPVRAVPKATPGEPGQACDADDEWTTHRKSPSPAPPAVRRAAGDGIRSRTVSAVNKAKSFRNASYQRSSPSDPVRKCAA